MQKKEKPTENVKECVKNQLNHDEKSGKTGILKKNVCAQKLIQNPEKAHKIKENKEKKDEKNNTK